MSVCCTLKINSVYFWVENDSHKTLELIAFHSCTCATVIMSIKMIAFVFKHKQEIAIKLDIKICSKIVSDL